MASDCKSDLFGVRRFESVPVQFGRCLKMKANDVGCLVCSKPLRESRSKYCSNCCQAEYQYRRYIENWKAGTESGVQAPHSISNHVRRYLIETRGEKCERCGWNETHALSGKVPLNVDHVDGCWNNCREENLKLLCPNCHSLTPNFGSRNRGNGRPARYAKTLESPPS